MSEPTLLQVYAAHCFFGCPHTAYEFSPESLHDAMERHYKAVHRPAIGRTVAAWLASGPARPAVPRSRRSRRPS